MCDPLSIVAILATQGPAIISCLSAVTEMVTTVRDQNRQRRNTMGQLAARTANQQVQRMRTDRISGLVDSMDSLASLLKRSLTDETAIQADLYQELLAVLLQVDFSPPFVVPSYIAGADEHLTFSLARDVETFSETIANHTDSEVDHQVEMLSKREDRVERRLMVSYGMVYPNPYS